jgi:hypothetical protein
MSLLLLFRPTPAEPPVDPPPTGTGGWGDRPLITYDPKQSPADTDDEELVLLLAIAL